VGKEGFGGNIYRRDVNRSGGRKENRGARVLGKKNPVTKGGGEKK